VPSEISDRYRRVSDAFIRTAAAVPAGAWDNPVPCEGWVARDVVAHLVGWLPGVLLDPWDIPRPALPPVADDPAATWAAFDTALRAALDDPEVAARERDTRLGRSTFAEAVDAYCTGDVLVHTWDLARATGQDETLDPDEVHRLLVAMQPYDEALRTSGHYGPAVPVPPDADEQTRLIAFTGRTP
jgi:uncharacterized protein (TIGR03086 family)